MNQEKRVSGGYSGKRLVINSVSNTARLGLLLVITFFLTPFIIRGLGNSLYGLWVVLLSFVAYANMLELGLQRAMVKLVAENRAAGDMPRLNRQMSAAFFFFLFSGLLVTLAFSFVLPLLIDKLARGVETDAIPYALFPIIGIDVSIAFLDYVFAGLLYGWQHYHRRNMIDVVSWLANAVLVLLLLGKWGLVGIAVAKTVSDFGGLVATFVLCRRTVPELSISLRHVTRSAFADLFSFGGRIFISSTMSRIATNAQPVIIGSMASASATAFFSIPKRLVDQVREIHWAMVAGFMPMFSDLNRRGDNRQIQQVYVSYSRRILLIMLPIVATVMVDGAHFISLWIGPEYAERGGPVLLLFATAYLAELFQPLLWSLFLGIGKLNLLVANSSAVSALILVLSFLLIGPFGIAGVASASAVAMVLGQIMFTAVLCREFRLPFPALLREVHLRPVLLTSVFLAMIWIGGRLVGTDSYLALALGALPGTAIYLFLFFRFGLNESERLRILSRFGRAKAPEEVI
jgi:O-antigen/teichoic acid export membrane protein